MLVNKNSEKEKFLLNLNPKEGNGMLKDNSERIERFLRDQMSEEENEAFISDLRSDPALREEAQMMALLIKGMNEEKEECERQVRELVASAAQGHVAAKPIYPVAARANENTEPARACASASKSGFTKFLFWACAVAAMFVLVFSVVNLSEHNYSEPLTAENQTITKKPQRQKPELEANSGDPAQNRPETMAEKDKDEDAEMALTEGGELPVLEIDAGKAKSNKIVKQLAELDQKLTNDKDLDLVIFELRNILDNIQSHNEHYAQYVPYEQKIKRMLYDAYIKTDDLNLALEMKKSLDDTEWAINDK